MAACIVQTLVCLIIFAYFGINDAVSSSSPCMPVDMTGLNQKLATLIYDDDACGNSTISSYYCFIQQNIIMDRYSAAACKSNCDENDMTCLENCEKAKFSECAECKTKENIDCAARPTTLDTATKNERSFCPSVGKWNIDLDRYPMRLAESECICSECRGKTGGDFVCEKLWTKVPVLKNTREKDSNGMCVYSQECIDISVGCTCVARPVHKSDPDCGDLPPPPP